MMKFVLGAAAAAFLLTGAAQAAVVDGSDVCGEVPNAKWSWLITDGGSTTSDPVFGEITYSGNSGNGFADVTVTTTTVKICTALNPQGKVNAEHSTTAESTSTSTTNQQVCFQSPNATDPAGDLCR